MPDPYCGKVTPGTWSQLKLQPIGCDSRSTKIEAMMLKVYVEAFCMCQWILIDFSSPTFTQNNTPTVKPELAKQVVQLPYELMEDVDIKWLAISLAKSWQIACIIGQNGIYIRDWSLKMSRCGWIQNSYRRSLQYVNKPKNLSALVNEHYMEVTAVCVLLGTQ